MCRRNVRAFKRLERAGGPRWTFALIEVYEVVEQLEEGAQRFARE